MIDDQDVPSVKLAYSIEEAGYLIGISRRTLYELIRTGEIGSIKIRNRRLIRHTDLVQYLDELGAAA